MDGNETPDETDAPQVSEERPLFHHPQWMVGVVIVFAVAAIFAALDDPLWLLIGSPFLLALAVYVWARFAR